jgi:hypothetical protein
LRAVSQNVPIAVSPTASTASPAAPRTGGYLVSPGPANIHQVTGISQDQAWAI